MSREEIVKKKVANKIKAAIKENNLTNYEFAKIVGISAQHVSKWLSGNQNFTIKTIVLIEEGLGIKIFNV